MKKPDDLYKDHLAIREFSVLPGEEWLPGFSGWSLIQVGSGSGYWLQAQSSTELEAGTVLLVAGNTPGRVRASQLNGMFMCAFNVMPARLIGLITLGEQDFLKLAASRQELALQVLAPDNPIAVKMKELCSSRNRGGLLFRLALLQLLVEAFGEQLGQTVPNQENTDARERLRAFLSENPADALLETSFSELAERTHCTTRHLSRIFYDLVGMSFGDKRAEIRLARARELLATSNSKVVDVALESGYKSLSLFNLMFTRRFGTSPGKWRQKYARNPGNRSNPSRGSTRLRPVQVDRQAFPLNPPEAPPSRRNIGEIVGVKPKLTVRL